MLSLLGLARNFIQSRRDHDAVESLELANALIERNGYDTPLPDAIGLLATALARSGEPQRAVSLEWNAWFGRGEEERTGRLQLFSVEAGYAEALFQIGDAERSLAAVERSRSDLVSAIPASSSKGSACGRACGARFRPALLKSNRISRGGRLCVSGMGWRRGGERTRQRRGQSGRTSPKRALRPTFTFATVCSAPAGPATL